MAAKRSLICVRCGRKMPRDLLLGYTHILDWTYVCRNSIECEEAARGNAV